MQILIFLYVVGLHYIKANFNVLGNPDFENGLSGWNVEGGSCTLDRKIKYIGEQSCHCVVGPKSTSVGVYKFLYPSDDPYKLNTYIRGVRYRAKGNIRMRSSNPKSYSLTYFEAASYVDGLYDFKYDKDVWISGDYTSIYFTNHKDSRYGFGVFIRGASPGDEIWIDNLSLEPAEMSLLIGVDVHKFKQELEPDEKVEVFFNIDGDTSVFENGTYLDVTMNIYNSTKGLVYTDKDFSMKFSNGKFKINSNDFKKGFHLVQLILKNQITNQVEQKTTIFKKLDKKIVRKWFVDEKNRIIYKGEPFFTFGLYLDYFNQSDFYYWNDSLINLIIEPGTYNGILDRVDEATKKQFFVLRSLREYSKCGEPLSKEYYDFQKRIALESRDHERTMGYYIADELHTCHVPNIRNRTLTFRSYDYHHFTWPAFNNYRGYNIYKDCFDVGGQDDYPISKYDDLHSIYVVSKTGKRLTQHSRAFIDIPQIFDWYVVDPKAFSYERPPTEQEMKQMSWQFIATGANGLIFYSYTDLQYNDVKYGRYPFLNEWKKVKETVKEINEYKDIILTHEDNNPNYWFPQENGQGYSFIVAYRQFRYKKYDYVLIVNPQNKVYDYSFVIPKGITSTSQIQKLLGKSTLNFNSTTHTVHFKMPAMDVIWLKIYDPNYTKETPKPQYSKNYTPNPTEEEVDEEPDIKWVPNPEGGFVDGAEFIPIKLFLPFLLVLVVL